MAKKARKKIAKKARRLAARARKAAPKKPSPVPPGYHTATVSFTINGAAAAIDCWKAAFGAKELSRMPAPDGKSIWHAEVKIGDTMIMLNDEMPGGPKPFVPGAQAPASMWLYVKNADSLFDRAVKAGCTVTMPVMDMFWGDRMGQVADPFGVRWSIAHRAKQMTMKEMEAAGAEFAKHMAAQQPPSSPG